jgi:glycosyltransferase involved in cell wall biosynthesis
MNQRTIAFLSSYPPTKCGLATFSAALREHLADHATQIGVVRVLSDQISKPELPEVVGHLVTGSRSSVAAALARLNTFDAVVIQHEYGIFGGIDGVDVLEYVAGLKVPVVVVMHTVLSSPTTLQRGILVELARSANVVITMSETARTRLIHLYGIPAEHVTVIPHGATDYRNAALCAPSHKDRPLILTWGLLGPGKGIEWAIDAMPALRGFNPRYLVTGQTHPNVLAREGQRYRRSLIQRAERRGVSDLVEISDTYLDLPQLAELIASADVVLLPYEASDQVTSGVLIEGVAAGRPVVATSFPHATELLAGGSGLTVPPRSPAAISEALHRVLTEPALAAAMAAAAARQAPELFWGAVAERYRQVLLGVISERRAAIA